MKIKEMAIDRYGAWSKLRLSDLDDRLNVVYGGNGSGKTTVVRFLQAMLYGFPHFQESPAPAQSSPWGGSVTVVSRQGRCVIRRHDNGTRTGRLSVLNAEGGAIDRDVLPELLSGVDEAVFRSLFITSLRDAPATETLVQTALAHGFDLAETRSDEGEHLRRLEEERREVERWKDRRGAVEAEIAAIERDQLLVRSRREEELRRVQEEIDRGEADLIRLRRELQALDDEIAAWEENRAAQSLASFAGPDEEEAAGQTLARRLQAIRSQLERWKEVQQDVLRRRTRLRREMMSWAAMPEAPAVLWEDAQKHIDAIERRLEQLQGEIRALAEPSPVENCNCREADRRCTPLVRAVRDEVYHLCRELHRHYLEDRRGEITEELRQLRRCHAEISSHMHRLGRRKERMERELAAQSAVVAPARLRRQETAERLRRCEAELARLHEERRRLERLPLLSEEETRLEARRRELETIQREIDRRLTRLAAYAGTEAWSSRTSDLPPGAAPAVLQEASEYLRRLTDGLFVHIHVWRNDRKVRIEDARGELHVAESLRDSQEFASRRDAATGARSVRDRVHLALCLALVAAYARRGVRLPLILDDAFLHLDADQAHQLGVLLCEFAGQGHQVFVFTSCESVARLFRRLDAPVLELPIESNLHEQHAIRWSAEPAMVEAAAPAAGGEPVSLTPAIASRGRSHSSRHYLYRSDSLSLAPDIDPAAARELTLQGTSTVGEFLSLLPTTAAQRLGHLHISAETIRQWQALARLMCDTPRLGAYDARILVASGVDAAEELERLGPEELLQRVERCLATEHGQRLFRMGDDEELARLASWVGSGRATQSLRQTQKRYASRWRRAERSRRWYDEAPSQAATLIPGESPLPVMARAEAESPKPRARRRFYLELSSPIDDAPSIGPRTAERLRAIGVKTVADLLTVSPESAARRIGHPRITAQRVRDWQGQAELVCTTPRLRRHDAQILVACGVRTAAQLAASEPMRLFELVEPFCASPEGQRLVAHGQRPDLAEVAHWIACAQHARRLEAA